MTPHINKIRKIVCIFIFVFLYACSGNEDIKKVAEAKGTDKSNIKEELSSKKTIQFIGSQVTVSQTQKKEYSEEQAEEILRHLKITILSDSVKVGNLCKFKSSRESYNANKMNYDTEGLIVNECGLLGNDITCISNFNGSNEGCERPYSKMIESKNKVIYFDGGYFFFFKENQSQSDDSYKIKEMSGVIGDTRQEWKIVYTYSDDLEKTYKDFLSRFPFGSKDISKSIIVKNQLDEINDIQYLYKSDLIEMKKNISVGTLYIKLKLISPGLTEVEYYLSFPFENSNYDG